MELTEDQKGQKGRCENDLCDCGDMQTQEQWMWGMRAQGWVDFGIDFQNLNKAHEDDEDYDEGVHEAYSNR